MGVEDISALHMWVVFAIIAGAVISYAVEKLSIEITSVAATLALLVFFALFDMPDGRTAPTPTTLLAGFAHPALITVLSLLIVGQGLFQTGALEKPAGHISDMASKKPLLTLTVTFLTAAVISAFMNNTPVVVMFIPILATISLRLGKSPSKTLMPMNALCILGGMTTLIGSSTNLLVAGVAEKSIGMKIEFFDFTRIGLVLAGIGAIYVIAIMPRLLKSRAGLTESLVGQTGKQFIAQIHVSPGHPFDGQKSVGGLFPALKEMTVRMIERDGKPILPPFEDIKLKPGDQIIVAATRKALTEALKTQETILTSPEAAVDDEDRDSRLTMSDKLSLAEAVIAPGSRMIGRSISQIGLRAETGCVVLGIQRRSRMIRATMSEIRLEAGDVILVLGSRSDIQGLRLNRDLLLMEWSTASLPHLAYSGRARTVFFITITMAALGVMPLVVVALMGALGMVLTGCLNIRQAGRAFDRRIYLLIGAALALATSMESTGGAAYLAHGVVDMIGTNHPVLLLSGFFLLVALLTNILSNNATAVLFTPIAIGIAQELNVDPAAFIFAVIFAGNCSFATPMAYQTNLLVMGPGHYRFVDFVKAGLPLVFIIWIAYSLIAPWYYGL